MGKIYEAEKVSERIEMISNDTGKRIEVTYKETFFSPKYKYATMIGCGLSIL